MPTDCTPMPPVTPDGWSEWQQPIMKGYRMQCCDCGLVHEVEFEVWRQTGAENADGTWPAEDVENGRLSWRMRRERQD